MEKINEYMNDGLEEIERKGALMNEYMNEQVIGGIDYKNPILK